MKRFNLTKLCLTFFMNGMPKPHYLMLFFLIPAILIISARMFPALAHPHAWIDLRSTVVLDTDGHVTAIEQQWLFDQFYTVFSIEELGPAANIRAQALKTLAGRNLKQLRAYDYFTEVRVDGKKVALGTVSDFESELRGGRLWMRFVVPLTVPIDPKLQVLKFSVFDPTYYTEILHLKDDVVNFLGIKNDMGNFPSAKNNDCFGRIVQPNLTANTVMLAQALDRDATPDNTLGSIFAEQVKVTCR